MNIAYVMNTEIPSKKANAVHVMKMCQALKAQGNDVTLYCFPGQNTKNREVFEVYGIKDKFNIVWINVNKSIRKYLSKLSILLGAMNIKKAILSKPNIDFVFGRSIYWIFFLRKKIDYIIEIHEIPNNALTNYCLYNILKDYRCKGVVVISEALKRRLLNQYQFLNSSKVTVLHDAADIPYYSKKHNNDKRNINTKTATIGYVGHLYPGKCMEVLILIATECSDLTFQVYGGTDELLKQWQGYLKENNINNIVLHGYIEPSEVSNCYESFDICIMPFSKEIMLGNKKTRDIGGVFSPLKLFEAMSHKKAILVSRLPSIEEVITDGVNGFLVDPDDIEGWKNRLMELIYNEDTRKKLGEKAYNDFLNNYTWNNRAKKIMNMIHRSLT